MRNFDERFWLIALVGVLVSSIILAFRFHNYSKERPELKSGYRKILIVYLLILLIPISILMLASVVGGVNIIEEQEFNFWTLSLHLYWLFLIALGALWIYFRNGAEFLSNHPGALRFRIVFFYENITSVFWIKAIFVLLAISVVVRIALTWISYN